MTVHDVHVRILVKAEYMLQPNTLQYASASDPTEYFGSSSQTPLSMLEQNVILEALLALLNRKQIINEEELLCEVKKRTGEKEGEMTIALNR